MKNFLLPILLLVTATVFAQKTDYPKEVTPEIAKKINAKIENEIPALLVKLEKNNRERTDKFDEGIKFGVDTFKIERYFEEYMKVDYSTAGKESACNQAADKYDALMNRYYKLLMAKLKPKDRPSLIAAQRSWIAFRDNESKLFDVLCKDAYSGGGTKENIAMADHYYTLVKERTLKLFEYYAGLYN
ncbi:lysozyme inhibitor LprI family protein [uncultured Mucilaginibacter sp.]|uniref:lysozyme inhibitor LprI family protein n=1 Tax=uncultured Mucilaginibacter sp. TaxID=797541 RepID=UPI0025D9D816|nr:lysozyme inhibitor LprI family protein [uncultured Mucilaginibacter sp.]